MDFIRVRELHKSFVYYRKQAGLKHSLKICLPASHW